MRILNVNMSIDPVTGGGTAERAVKIAQYLARSGVAASLLTSELGVTDEMRQHLRDVDICALKSLNNRFHVPRFGFDRIARLVASADVVHLMNHWTLINAAVYRACRKQDKPYVFCPAGALSYFGRSIPLKKAYNLVVGNRIVRDATRHIAIPADEAQQFLAYGIDPQTVDIIPNGIDQNDFCAMDDDYFRRKYALGEDPFILFLGRLNPIKGPDLLLDAFIDHHRDFPEYRLVFAGPDGGMRKAMEEKTNRCNLADRVRFTGYIGGDDKSCAYHAAGLLVIPSRQEAMSIVALEAGISGTPLLLTDVCGLDRIESIGGGLSVKPTAQDIGKGLKTLLVDRTALASKGRVLKDYVAAHYTWDAVIKKYISLFEDVLR
ncbi:MAG: glycosyltransferase [Pseudomonadota bacterium]